MSERKGVPINFTFCIRCGAQMKPHDASTASKTPDVTHVGISELIAMLDTATRLNEIIEGCGAKEWTSDGLRLKDTPEWCDFYKKLYRARASAANL